MHRRSLLKALVGVSAVLGARVSVAPVRGKTYGPMTIKRHLFLRHRGINLRVFHNGRDVTSRCYYADDTGEGTAGLFRLNEHGRKYVDAETRDPAKETVIGVTFVEGPPLKHA